MATQKQQLRVQRNTENSSTNYQLYCPWKLASLWDQLCYIILSLANLRRYLVASLNYLDYSRAVYIVEDLLLSPTCRLVHMLHYRHLGLIYPVVPTDLTAFLLTQLDHIGYCIGMTVLYWMFLCNNNLSIFPIDRFLIICFSSKHSRFIGQVAWSSSYNAVIIARLVLRLLSPNCHPIPIIRRILSFHGLIHVLGFR